MWNCNTREIPIHIKPVFSKALTVGTNVALFKQRTREEVNMDLLLINGQVYTMNQKDEMYDAVAINDGKIEKLGSTDEILALRTEDTAIIDLKGKAAIPGFNDSHMHLLSYGYSKQIVYLDGCRSLAELQSRVANFIKYEKVEAGQWVEGRGWDQNEFDVKEIPTRLELDQISANIPIVLGRTCGQMCIANTKALETLDLLKPQQEMEHGTVIADGNQIPTGIFTGEAINLIYGRLPKLGTEKIKGSILRACEEYVTAGITSLQTDDFELKRAGTPEDVLKAYFELDGEGSLPLRVNLMMYLPTAEDIQKILDMGYKTGYGSPFFRIGPCKTDTDGSLGGRTAALEEDYSDEPGNRGEIYFDRGELEKMVTLAYENQCQFVCDAIGDRALNMVIDAYSRVLESDRENKYRFGIDHCQITNPEILNRFKEYNLTAGLELGFVMSDIYIAEERLGRERARHAYNWKSFVDAGLHCAAGSDNPVEPFEPLHGIYAAVTRRNWDGEPENGWLPEQKLSVKEAVRMFTSGSAFATFEEGVKGTLDEGKYADVAVLSKDIFQADIDEIPNIKVEATIVNGRVVFENISN